MDFMCAIRIRTLFVSDVHLGFRHARPSDFLSTIKAYDPEHLIIVGDFIDGRRLSHRWKWSIEFDQIFHHFKLLARNGCRIHYLPGNHDEFLRIPENQSYDFLDIRNEFEFPMNFGGSVSILHGDIYDRTETEKTIGTRVGCRSYDLIVRIHSWINILAKRLGVRRLDVCSVFKTWLWQAHRHINSFREKLCRHARFKNHSGVVCGHIHYPQLSIIEGILYLNTGDWVENSSYGVETDNGDLHLYNHCCLAASKSVDELTNSLEVARGRHREEDDLHKVVIQEFEKQDLATEFQNQILDYHLRSA